MIILRYNNAAQLSDIVRDGGNIQTSDLLETAVLISLFTRQRAREDDVLPDSRSGNREGWWADAYSEIEDNNIGSRLWFLSREKLTTNTLNRAKTYSAEALQWLIDDGIADAVDVETERQGSMLAIGVSITKPGNPASKWQAVWAAHLAEL